MAKRRQTYNLDRQTKLFDIHKQFMGGLKTIDTDDALGSVYLRDIDNLSLSEFGFLEKRYGTYVSDQFPGIEFESDKPIQGYFEYIDDDGDVHKILFYNGVPYIQNPKAEDVNERNVFIARTGFITEPSLTYPDTTQIENDTGWESGQFDPVTPSEPVIPPPPPGPISLIAKSSTLARYVIPGLEELELFAKSSTSAEIVIPGNETIGLVAKSLGSKAFFVESSRFDVSLLGKASLKAAISTADLSILPLSAKSKTTSTISIEATQFLSQLSAVASGNSRFTFFAFEPISTLSANASTKSEIDFTIPGKTATPLTETVLKTETSVTFRIINQDPDAVSMSYEIATAQTGGTVVKSGEGFVLAGFPAVGQFEGLDRTTVSESNLNEQTTYWLRAVFTKADVKTISDAATPISLTTDATPIPQLDPPDFVQQGLQISQNQIDVTYFNPNNVPASLRVFIDQTPKTVSIGALEDSTVSFVENVDIQYSPGDTLLVSARLENATNFLDSEYVDDEINIPAQTVTATFNSAGGSPINSISGFAPLSVSSPSSPSRTGYNFVSWSPSLPRTISSNTTFTAQWQARTYTVTFDKQSGTGGTNFATATFDSNMPSATAPTRSGFSFNGYWDAISGGTRYYNNNMTSARTWNKANNATLFARWTACLASGTTIGSPYCVGFDLYQTKANGSCGTYADLIEVNSSSCGYVGPTTATPSTGTDSVTSTSVTFTVANNDDNSVSITWNIREGSQFGSVVRNGTINNVGVGNLGLRNIVGSNLNSGTIYYLTDVIATASGKFASAAGTVRNLTTTTPPPAPTVTATFSSNGGSPTYNSQSGPSPLSVSNPGSPTRSGFTFLGWSPSVPTTITSNTFFTAQWQDNTPAPTVTATFNSAGGTPTYNSQSGSAPLYVTSPGSPTRSGFTFLGWSPSVNTDITSNTTFTAQWQDDTPTPTTYTVSAGITRNTQGSWYLLAPADWESVAGSVSGTTTITTMGLTTLTSSVPENGDFTIFVPSSVNYNGETYTFISWVVNGVNQPQGENLYSISSVQGNLTLQAVYETFGLGGF